MFATHPESGHCASCSLTVDIHAHSALPLKVVRLDPSHGDVVVELSIALHDDLVLVVAVVGVVGVVVLLVIRGIARAVEIGVAVILVVRVDLFLGVVCRVVVFG